LTFHCANNFSHAWITFDGATKPIEIHCGQQFPEYVPESFHLITLLSALFYCCIHDKENGQLLIFEENTDKTSSFIHQIFNIVGWTVCHTSV